MNEDPRRYAIWCAVDTSDKVRGQIASLDKRATFEDRERFYFFVKTRLTHADLSSKTDAIDVQYHPNLFEPTIVSVGRARKAVRGPFGTRLGPAYSTGRPPWKRHLKWAIPTAVGIGTLVSLLLLL